MCPTNIDFILATLYLSPILLAVLGSLIGINWDFNPKDNDPYRYCPKEV